MVGLPESPEAAQTLREADEKYNKQGDNFDDNLSSLKDSLGYGDFNSTVEEPVDVLDGINTENTDTDNTYSETETETETETDSSTNLEYLNTEFKDSPDYKLLLNFKKEIDSESSDTFEAIEDAMLNNVSFNEVISLLSPELQEDILSEKNHINHIDKQIVSKESVLNGMEFNTGYTAEEINNKVTNTSEREKNSKQANDLFYKDGMVEKLIEQSSNGDTNKLKENKEFFNNEEVQEDLETIMGNFVTDIEGESLTDIFQEGGEEQANKINESLNLAFEMQVNVVLDGKINYDLVAVDNLLVNLQEGNPFDKLRAFEDIKILVNSSEAKGGKHSLAFQKRSIETKEEILDLQGQFDNAMYMLEIARKENNKEKLIEVQMDLKSIKLESKPGEVFEGGDIDKLLKEIQEELKEQA